MFGPPGRLYVYFTYGMHWCANVVGHLPGDASAVLLRAAAPVDGVDLMRSRRLKARRDRELCAGPARLCQAFSLTGVFDGADLTGGELRIVDDGVPPPRAPGVSTRVGLRAGEGDESMWRFLVLGDPHISRGPRPIAG
jgi:DNA-3-methyladenine glycosylase